MSDTSFYDARIYEERLCTEFARQKAADLEIEYWTLRMQKEGLKPLVNPTEPPR